MSQDHPLEAFSDGVFAVAITLLVIDLTVRRLGIISGTTSRTSGRRSASFFVSFWVIGTHLGQNHHGVLDHVKRADRGVLYLNLLVLMTARLSPFRNPRCWPST